MYRTITTLLLLISFNIGFAQVPFLYQRKSMEEIRVLEKNLGSQYLGLTEVKVAKDYFPTAEDNHVYYPLTFKRTNDSFYPTLVTTYFYKESDSTLLSASYDWDIMSEIKSLITDGEKLEKERKRKKEYLAKYDDIKQELINEFGQPTVVEENKNSQGYFYRLRWNTPSNDILVLLKFSNQLMALTNNMKVGSFAIRVKIDYK